jgi:hypothetical protein
MDEINKEAIYLIQQGVNGMLDEIIDKNMNILSQPPFIESVKYFVEKGIISGQFLLQLRKMLKEYGETCEAVQCADALEFTVTGIAFTVNNDHGLLDLKLPYLYSKIEGRVKTGDKVLVTFPNDRKA